MSILFIPKIIGGGEEKSLKHSESVDLNVDYPKKGQTKSGRGSKYAKHPMPTIGVKVSQVDYLC